MNWIKVSSDMPSCGEADSAAVNGTQRSYPGQRFEHERELRVWEGSEQGEGFNHFSGWAMLDHSFFPGGFLLGDFGAGLAHVSFLLFLRSGRGFGRFWALFPPCFPFPTLFSCLTAGALPGLRVLEAAPGSSWPEKGRFWR